MKSKVVILGVNHAYQLVSKECRPAAYRAFIERVKPDGIGIERSPERFIRSDFYDFTFEQQSVVVPFALEKGIQLHPFDWNLSTEDQLLAWNIHDIDEAPFVRGNSTYKDFVYFPSFNEDFFYSERKEVKEQINNWMHAPLKGESDFPRRLFLYRTFMQAMRIKHISKQYKGKTLLIIVGHMHKQDIEGILAQEEGIEIIQPSSFGYPREEEILQNQHISDLFAIAAFNLMGVQAQHSLDKQWMEEVITKLNEHGQSVEIRLFTLLFERGKFTNEQMIENYQHLLGDVSEELKFTYDGVKDNKRIDSYFNPFGNLSINAYIYVLIAKEYIVLGNEKEAIKYKTSILENEKLNPQQKKQFEVYWDRFIDNRHFISY